MKKIIQIKAIITLLALFFLGINNMNAQTYETYSTTFTNLSGSGGLGSEAGLYRGDPSDVIKVGNLYYVWYWRVEVNPSVDYDTWSTWYATSPDGYTWTEKGEAIPQGPDGSWDDEGTFTPGILVFNNTYYLYYTGVSEIYTTQGATRIGVASSNSPDGPWIKSPNNPILVPGTDADDFDSHRMDDASLIVRNGKAFMYYKGRKLGEGPGDTTMGLAVASNPEGPFTKHEDNPLIEGGHEVVVWPQGAGVATLVGTTGPSDINRSIRYAADGVNFVKTHESNSTTVPWGPGAYRPDAFTNNGQGEVIEWGLHRAKSGGLEFLQRYDLTTSDAVKILFTPDPDKEYFIDNVRQNLRLAATGSSETPVAIVTSSTGNNTRWKFVAKGNGYWHIQRSNGGSLPRLRSDKTVNADMQATSSSGSWTYFEIEQSTYADDTYYLTLPDLPADDNRLTINKNGQVKFAEDIYTDDAVSFIITEVGSSSAKSSKSKSVPESVSTTQLRFPTLINEGHPEFKPLNLAEMDGRYTIEIYSIDGKLQYYKVNTEEGWTPSREHNGMFFYKVNYQNKEGVNIEKRGKFIVQ